MKLLNTYFFLIICCLALNLQAQQVSTHTTIPQTALEQIVWGHNGRIYVVDFSGGKVFRVTAPGQYKTLGTFSGPLGGAMDQDGNYYFSEYYGGKVFKVSPDDTVEEYSSGFNGPTGILIDTTNQIMYVAEYNIDKLTKIDMTGSPNAHTTFASGRPINGPDGMVFTPEGDLITANFKDNQLLKITPEGQVSSFTTINGTPNTGYLVRRGDHYFISGFNSHKIYRIEQNGDVSILAGTGVPGTTNGPADQAQFSQPNGIALSPGGDSLLVSTGPFLRLITNLDISTSLDWPSQALSNLQLFPNPVANHLDLAFELPESQSVQITLLDAKGAVVDTILSSRKLEGSVQHRYQRPARLSAGIYFVAMQIDQQAAYYRVIFNTL